MPEIRIRQSELSSWANCRRATAFQYWEGYARKRSEFTSPPSKADIGSIVHRGLEFHYRDGARAGDWVRAEAKRIADSWATPTDAGIIPAEMSDAWKDAYNLATIMCDGYEEWLEDTGADAGWIITGVERECEAYWGEVNGYNVYVVGHIDLEAIDALGRPILVDHKSVAGLGEPEGPVDFQRATYAVLRRLEDGTKYAALYHNQLKRVKRTARATPPFYGRNEVQFNDDHLRKHYQHMNVIIGEITSARAQLDAGIIDISAPVLYPRPSRDCSWRCPAYNACVMFDDGADWKGYLDEFYEKRGAEVPGQQEEAE